MPKEAGHHPLWVLDDARCRVLGDMALRDGKAHHLMQYLERPVGTAGMVLAVAVKPARHLLPGDLMKTECPEGWQQLAVDIDHAGYSCRRLLADKAQVMPFACHEITEQQPCLADYGSETVAKFIDLSEHRFLSIRCH